MIVVGKQSLTVGTQQISWPLNAIFLTAKYYNDALWVWAKVDDSPDVPTAVWDVLVVGTGWSDEKYSLHGYTYLSTVQEGPFFIWHVFYR